MQRSGGLLGDCQLKRAPSFSSQIALFIANRACIYRSRFDACVPQPPLHNIERHSFLIGLNGKRMPKSFRLAQATGDPRFVHDGLHNLPRGRAAPRPKALVSMRSIRSQVRNKGSQYRHGAKASSSALLKRLKDDSLFGSIDAGDCER